MGIPSVDAQDDSYSASHDGDIQAFIDNQDTYYILPVPDINTYDYPVATTATASCCNFVIVASPGAIICFDLSLSNFLLCFISVKIKMKTGDPGPLKKKKKKKKKKVF